MEFWGEEVNPGKTVSCEAGDGFVIHLSQAALGETKKASENIVVSVKVGDKKLVIGTLSADKHPQVACDLIFDQDFEVSHSSKTTSVFMCGYKTELPDMFESDSGEEEEDEVLETDSIPKITNATEKSAAKVPAKDGKKGDDESDDSEMSSGADDFSDDSEDESESDDESSDEDEMSSGADDFSDGSEEEEETPKPEVGKKRAAETALKTPASDKKAKVATPSGQKTGDKKSVHVATPHPAKQASKTPADSKPKEKAPKTPADGKSKEKAPKTPAGSKSKKSPKSGSHSCKSCSKTFNSGGALEAHQKAKNHEA